MTAFTSPSFQDLNKISDEYNRIAADFDAEVKAESSKQCQADENNNSNVED